MNKYQTALIDNASKLDAVTGACGIITKLAVDIVGGSDKNAPLSLVRIIAEIVNDQDSKLEFRQLAQAVRSSLIEHYGYIGLQNACKEEEDVAEESLKTLSELLTDLNALIGLESVKKKVNDLIAYQKVQKIRRENNMYSPKHTLHLAFMGNPGTGKTTVARIVGHIYKQLGLLSKGHFVEVSRTDLIAGYQGQTALKVRQVIDKAKGGVLFIDEAYSITENDHSDAYGRECLTELTKALEDYRDDLVVIVAGYVKPMEKFFDSNPGLKSRFNTFVQFNDYDADELFQILVIMCQTSCYHLSAKAEIASKDLLARCILHKDEYFANGRLVRNLYDDLVMSHARRIAEVEKPSKEELSLIVEGDVKSASLYSSTEW